MKGRRHHSRRAKRHHRRENYAQKRQGEYKIINQESISITLNALNNSANIPALTDANDLILPFTFPTYIWPFFRQLINNPEQLTAFKYFTCSKFAASYVLYHRDTQGLVQRVKCSWLRDANCNSCTLNGNVNTQYSPLNVQGSGLIRSAMLYKKHGYRYSWKYRVKAPGRWALQTQELIQLGNANTINLTWLIAFIEGTAPNEGNTVQPAGPFSRTYQPKGFNVYCAPDYYAFTQAANAQPVMQGQYLLECKYFVKIKLWNTNERVFNRSINGTVLKDITPPCI